MFPAQKTDWSPQKYPPGSTVALYYPFIQFRSSRWLRTAALYYDGISRIVPPGVDPEDPEHLGHLSSWQALPLLNDVKELKSAGFIVDESPNDSVSAIANEFFDFAMENLLDPSRRAALVPELSWRADSYNIHKSKIDPELSKVLVELQLAHETQGDVYSSLKVERITGALYMLFLATKMAGKRQLVSDNPIYQSLLLRKPPDQQATQTGDNAFRLAAAVIEHTVPEDADGLSLDSLLRLRESFADERRRFQDRVASLAKDLAAITDEKELLGKIERQSKLLVDEQSVLKQKLQASGLTFCQSLFSVSVPTYVTAQWGFGATAHWPIFAALTVAVSTVAMKYVLDKRSTRDSSPLSYLMRVGDSYNRKTMAKDIVTLNLQTPDDEDDRLVMA